MRIFIDEPFKCLMTTKAELVVNSPVDKVFECVADVGHYDEWLLSGRIEKISDGPVKEGCTFAHTETSETPSGGTVTTTKLLTVTELVANQWLAYESKSGGARIRTSFEVRPAAVAPGGRANRYVAGGSRIKYRVASLDFGLFVGIMGLVFLPVVVPFLALYRPLYSWWMGRKLRRIESRVR